MLRVEVRWIDSGTWYADGWETKDKIAEKATLSEVATVGWLMMEDDDAYYVCLTYDPENNHFFGTQVIAKANVTSLTRLRARTLSAGEIFGNEEDEPAYGASNPTG